MTEQLRALQQAFAAHVCGAASSAPTDASWVAQPDAARRLDVYRSAVAHNWRAALQAVYPVCRAWVGDAFFNEAVRQHLAQSPSTSGDLHELGAGFADFLSEYSPAADQALLPDLARLEWALHRAFHAQDGAPIAATALADIAPDDMERLTLVLLPGTTLITSRWPILALWKAHQPGGDLTTLDTREDEAQHIVVWREGFESALAPIDAAAACLVRRAHTGEPLLQALAHEPFSNAADPGALLGASLRTVFELGLIGRLHVIPSHPD